MKNLSNSKFYFLFFSLLVTFIFICANNVYAKKKLSIDPKNYKNVTFKELRSFEYIDPSIEEVKNKTFKDQVPEKIKNLDKKKVMIKGFMIPMEFDKKGISYFLYVASNFECCFGAPPSLHAWVDTRMKTGEFTPYYQDVAIKAYGTLYVGEHIDSHGNLTLYRFIIDDIDPPKGKYSIFWD